MTHEQLQQLFRLNDRLISAFAIMASDVKAMEEISGVNMTPAMEGLDQFASAMTQINDKLNEQVKEYNDEQLRKKEVNDVLREVNNKIQLKRKYEEPGKDRSQPS